MKKQVFNPFLPSYEYIPDGEPYVFNERVYIFGSHDKFNGRNFCLNNYVSWSTPCDNLGEWLYEGVIYDKYQDPFVTKKTQFMAAPDVQIGLDGRYYLYYFFGYKDSPMGVAVSDTPTGKYQFYGHVKYPDGTLLGKAKNDPLMFDPGIFVEDGHVFLYNGFSPRLLTRIYINSRSKMDGATVIELENDMITVKKKPKTIIPRKGKAKGTGFEGHEFFEASSMRKRNDVYYFIYSSDKNHELCYATSKCPTGPFKFGGVIISNADIGYEGRLKNKAVTYYGNNHGSMVDIKDKTYIFYHRHTNRHSFSRQACAEQIRLNTDGSINQVEVTSCGLNNGPLLGKGIYPSHIACNLFSRFGAGSYSPFLIFKSYRKHPYLTQTGIDRNENPDQYIANMRHGSVAGYKYFLFDNMTKISVTLFGEAEGQFQIFTSLIEKPIGYIQISNSNNKVFSTEIKPLSGVHPIYFKYIGKGKINFISFEFQQ